MQLRFTTDSLNTFFARQTEYISKRLLDVIYAELKAVKYLPVNSEAGPGATTYTWRMYDMQGAAQFIANYGTDFRNVNVSGNEYTVSIYPIGDAYEWNFQDLRTAMIAEANGQAFPLEMRLANAAVRAVMQLENTVLLYGYAPLNIFGWFNQPSIPTGVVPATGTGGSTLFVDKTPDQIIADVASLIDSITINTREVEIANMVVMATSTKTLLKHTRVSQFSDTSILEWLQGAYADQIPPENWVTLVELENAGPGGTRMMIAYNKNPDKIEAIIPQPLEQLPTYTDGLIWKNRLHERIAGVICPYPLSNNFLTGM